jgi:hypothetical protein
LVILAAVILTLMPGSIAGGSCGNSFVALARQNRAVDPDERPSIFETETATQRFNDANEFCRSWAWNRLFLAAGIASCGVAAAVVGWLIFQRPRRPLPPSYYLRRPPG